MSVCDIKEYYKQVCDQYNEMIQNLKDMEEYSQKNMVEPERLDQFKEALKPIKENYLTLSYIIFLLNRPNKKEKQKKYLKQHKKELDKIPYSNTQEGKIEKGKQTLEELNKIAKG